MKLNQIKKHIYDIKQLISKGYVINDFVRDALTIHPPPCVKEQYFTVELPNKKQLKFFSYKHMPLLYTIDEVIHRNIYTKNLTNIDYGLRDSVVIDIGANIGLFSIYISSMYECKAYAIEMDSINFTLLQQNVKHNIENCNVICCNQAIEKKGGVVQYVHGYDLVGSRVVANEFKKGEVKDITSVTLGGFLEQEEIEQVSLLKMDCEGSEYEIILGLDGSTFERIQKISFEYHFNKSNSKTLLKKAIATLERNYNKVYVEHDEIRGNLGMVWAE